MNNNSFHQLGKNPTCLHKYIKFSKGRHTLKGRSKTELRDLHLLENKCNVSKVDRELAALGGLTALPLLAVKASVSSKKIFLLKIIIYTASCPL